MNITKTLATILTATALFNAADAMQQVPQNGGGVQKKVRFLSEHQKDTLIRLANRIDPKDLEKVLGKFLFLFPGTPKDMLYKCWVNYLDPNIKRGPWTQEEDRILLEKYHELGEQWTEIAKYLQGRPPVAVLTRVRFLQTKGITESNQLEKIHHVDAQRDAPVANKAGQAQPDSAFTLNTDQDHLSPDVDLFPDFDSFLDGN